MKILNLKLLNFRNYEKVELSFDESKNIIIGKNGMGKTNIVEAIYVLAFTKSFRGSKESVVIRKNCDLARVEGTVVDKYKNSYKILLRDGDKKVKIDNNNIDKISEYLSRINIILFTSDDLKLIKDTPNTRRKLINVELSQFSNEYLKLATYYNKVLKQRNAYLKTMYFNGMASKDYLNILTGQLVELGLKIHDYRCKFIDDLSTYVNNNYHKITENDSLELSYKSDFNDLSKEEILNNYNKLLEKDIQNGKTMFGIHRDDYEFKLNGMNIRDFGSEGEQKNAIISFKMAELDIFREQKDIIPILILDDLFSELDEQKINNILKFISNDIQTFVTTTELDKLNDNLINNSKIYEVVNGNVIEKEKNYE